MTDRTDTASGSVAPVTVIVPTYNRGAFIGQAIDSLLAQTARPAEVIVVVDGSTDDTMEVLEAYGGQIRVLRTENGGKSRALNAALPLVTQPFVWIFDDDDVACPLALERLHAALAAEAGAGFSYGTFDRFQDSWPSPVSAPQAIYRSRNRTALYVALMQGFFIWQGAMLVRTECYRAVGGFDERFTRSQDYQMALRLLRRFGGVAVPHVVFHQRDHSGERGPGHARARARDSASTWAGFNAMMFREIYESHRLEEFCCLHDGGPLDARSTITALIQRAAIMARRGLWDKAISDMGAAASRASAEAGFALNLQEVTALRAVFEQGSGSQFRSLREARSFRAAIRKFDGAVAAKVLGNLMLPVSHRARSVPRQPRRMQEARQLGLVLFCLLGGGALREYLAARRSEHRRFGVHLMAPQGSR